MDFLNHGIPLGKWLGTRVVLSVGHIIMLVYLASGAERYGPVGMGIVGLVFFLSILLHEFGHVIACKLMGGRAEAIILGPMGGLAAVEPPDRPLAHLVTTAGGPAVNALLWVGFWGLLKVDAVLIALARGDSELATAGLIFCVYMIQINQILLILNLLPIFPMDGGRIMQSLLWPVAGYRNSQMITGMIGTVGGVGLVVLGLGLREIRIPYVDFTLGGESDYLLLFIGLTCAMGSWGLYQRSQEIEGWRKN
jgi:Zn-dependent protease